MKTFNIPGELGPLEKRVMTWVWRASEGTAEFTIRDLFLAFGERPAYTTLMTTADRLFKKGLLNRRKSQRAFFYSARVSRREYGRSQARDIVRSFLGSRQDAEPLLSCLVDVV